jgi:hypothetical protein
VGGVARFQPGALFGDVHIFDLDIRLDQLVGELAGDVFENLVAEGRHVLAEDGALNGEKNRFGIGSGGGGVGGVFQEADLSEALAFDQVAENFFLPGG